MQQGPAQNIKKRLYVRKTGIKNPGHTKWSMPQRYRAHGQGFITVPFQQEIPECM